MFLKTTEKSIQENSFEQKKKKPGLNLPLGANRPSNNWAQGFQEVCRTIPPAFSRSIRRGKVFT